jgi:competence protein ComEA
MKWKKKLVGSMVIFAVFAFCLAVGYFTTRPAENVGEDEIFAEEPAAVSQEVKTITVYVNGEVVRPGVYTLAEGSRIKDVVEASGGFAASADTRRVNLAKKLRDEDYVFIDSQGASQGSGSVSQGGTGSDGIININTATKEELMTLPGVGEVTAQKIIDYREKNGDFGKVEDLTKVDRIGEKTLAKFKDKIEAR